MRADGRANQLRGRGRSFDTKEDFRLRNIMGLSEPVKEDKRGRA